MWNHPPNPANFKDFAYYPVAKDGMRLIEFNGAGTWALKQEEHLRAPSFNEDNPCTANFQRNLNKEKHFVAMAIQEDGDRVISAPIWYKE